MIFCAPEKRPCIPKDTILTPGFGYSITPVPKFPDRQGRKNRVQFPMLSLQPLDLSACRPEFLFNFLVAAIEVVDAIDDCDAVRN